MTNPISATAQSHLEDLKCSGASAAIVRDVVVAVTTNAEVELALTVRLAGATEHAAPLGAPVHVSTACPPHPAPPIDSLYVAGDPAVTLAVFELAVRPKPPAAAEVVFNITNRVGVLSTTIKSGLPSLFISAAVTKPVGTR
jgi:hypothetical protein